MIDKIVKIFSSKWIIILLIIGTVIWGIIETIHGVPESWITAAPIIVACILMFRTIYIIRK